VFNEYNIPAWIVALTPEALGDWYNEDITKEIEAIAEIANLKFGVMFLMNMIYEVSDACTSIIC